MFAWEGGGATWYWRFGFEIELQQAGDESVYTMSDDLGSVEDRGRGVYRDVLTMSC